MRHTKLFRSLALLTIATAMAASCATPTLQTPIPWTVAHRGCWLKEGNEFYIPENCPAGVEMAARFGYPAIECDVKYTLDSVMVIMHDKTINRTMRTADGYQPIAEPVAVKDVTFEELRTKYVLASTDPALRTPIPTLEEELTACKKYGIVAMLHSAVPESYRMAQDMLGDKGWICFSSDPVVLKSREFSKCLVLRDPGKKPVETTLQYLKEIGQPCGMSTMKYNMLDKAYIQSVKDAGFEVQASIFPSPHEQRALMDGVTIELTDFFWFQTEGREPAQVFKKGRTSLAEGETLTWNASEQEFAGLTLVLKFEGEVEVSFCGRQYTFRHDTPAEEVLGVRMYKTAPSITVKALSPVKVSSCRADLYQF